MDSTCKTGTGISTTPCAGCEYDKGDGTCTRYKSCAPWRKWFAEEFEVAKRLITGGRRNERGEEKKD